jgi:polar amino acid transport system substrate-binding protein
MKKRAITKRFILIFMAAIFLLTLMPALNAFAKKEMSTWDAVKKRGSFRYGAVSNLPYFYRDPKTGKAHGLSVKYAEDIAKVMGVKAVPVDTTWGNMVAALQSGQIDMAPFLIPVPARAMAVEFINNPIAYMVESILIHKDLNVTDWNDLKKLKIAVGMGSANDIFITKKFPEVKIIRYPSADESFAAFQSGRAEVFVTMSMSGIAYLSKAGNVKLVIPKPVFYSGLHNAVRREPDKTWRDFLNTCAGYYYTSGKVQEWLDETMVEFSIDPKNVPSVMKERW